MSTDAIVRELNEEIVRLIQARNLLISFNGNHRIIRRRRPMSSATKAKISAAMEKSWAQRRTKAN